MLAAKQEETEPRSDQTASGVLGELLPGVREREGEGVRGEEGMREPEGEAQVQDTEVAPRLPL